LGLKSKLYQHCLSYIGQRIETSRQAIAEAQHSADEETKSSAGDKYETGRAMMQLEMEKHASQLEESQKLKRILEAVDIHVNSEVIIPGSIVFTDQTNFFLSIGAGQVDIDGKIFLNVSAASPIGNKMIGLKAGDSFQMNTKTYKILKVE
jgi:transcription elongation GreA/GreB family factor